MNEVIESIISFSQSAVQKFDLLPGNVKIGLFFLFVTILTLYLTVHDRR